MAPSPQNLGLLLVYFLSFLFGLPANLLALWAFVGCVCQPHPTPIHILLLSLTLADLLLLLLLLLLFKMVEAVHNFAWPLENTLCALTGFGFYCGIYCSTWLLVGISVERYCSVAFPVPYKLNRRPVYGVIAAVAIWILSFGHCRVVIIVQYLPTNSSREANSRPVCYDNFTQEQLRVVLLVRLELCLPFFFIPMGVTIFCYWRLVRILLSQSQVVTRKHWRTVALVVATLFNFLVCFRPYNVSHVVVFFHKTSERWRVCAVMLTALNACIDPLILYFSSSAVHRAFDKRLQSGGASLAGYWRRQAGQPTAERGNGSLGAAI
ncbi:free fatty acid receptor 2-like [Bubalus kerabau]|uniref:free fatty acid receptor 2-like n=1 Tax=Bubalus carabanensis TaxID=3119969 RepID=UPI00244E62B2|nr:free fatty acid receptor 2-like [Bubalus carabanensis]